MTEMVDITQAAKMLGYKNNASVTPWAKKVGLVQTKKGRKVYYYKDEILAKMKAHAKPTKPGKKQTAGPAQAPSPLKPIVTDPKLVAWDKGKFRGWCFAAIDSLDDDLVTMLTNYGKQYEWPTESVLSAIVKGEMFVAEPGQVLHFMALQLIRTQDNALKPLVQELEVLAAKFDAVEQEYKE